MAGFRLVPVVQEAVKVLKTYHASRERLERLGLRAEGLMYRDSTRSFVAQADPTTGRKWEPSRRAIKQHGQTLLDTGRLRRSVAVDHRVIGPGLLEVQGGTLPVAYAKIHQFGGVIKHRAYTTTQAHSRRGKFISRYKATMAKRSVRISFAAHGAGEVTIPARPYVGMSPESRSVVTELAGKLYQRGDL